MSNENNRGTYEPTPDELLKLTQFFQLFKSHLGFQLPPDVQAAFESIHKFLQNEDAAAIRERLSPTGERRTQWYNMLHDAVINDCQRQAGACLYHLDNLIRWENLAIQTIQNGAVMDHLSPGQTMALSAEKIDFEFHALTLALKAYLSYVASAVFIFFKTENHTFNKYRKTLKGKVPQDISERIITVLDEHWPRLSMYYSIGERRAVRDTLAHYKFVGAGWINIYGGLELQAAYAMPKEIIRNEVTQPDFRPTEVDTAGLGISKLMSENVSYILTTSMDIFRVLNILK